MKLYADRMRSLRLKKGLSQDQLAALLKISRSAVGMYETGQREPDYETSEAIADIFNVDMDYLIGRSDVPRKGILIPPGFDPMPNTVTVPLVGAIACGNPITAEENLEGTVNIPEAWGATFALICKGDSMEPRIKNGDLVAIRQQPDVENGQIAAVRLDNEATLKKVYFYSDRLELRPINPDYESIVLYGEEINTVAIEGLAVGLCRGLVDGR